MQPNQPSQNPNYLPPQASNNPLVFAGQPTVSYSQTQQTPPIPTQQPANQTNAQPLKINPNSTQNSLQFAEIREGILIMNDGTFRAIVMARSINFDLMSTAEQDSVEFGYQSFLNSLYFDTQILVQSRKIDMGPYVEKLDHIQARQNNMLLGMLMADYIDFIEDLVENTNIMDKKFYVVVQYSKAVGGKQVVKNNNKILGGLFGGNSSGKVVVSQADLEEAKTELRNRVAVIVNGLVSIGVQSIPLDTKELIELFYNSYNPDLATREPFNSSVDFSAPVVTKGDGYAPKPNMQGVVQ